MLGTKVYKPIVTQDKCDEYGKLASWCNSNNAMMKDKGDYYEVVEIVIPEKTPEEKADSIRAERDQKLNDTVWLVERHKSEKELGIPTTLTEDQYMEVLRYQQNLREVPQQATFPDSVVFPEFPDLSDTPTVIPETEEPEVEPEAKEEPVAKKKEAK